MARFQAYAQLVRLPNLFTAMADVLGGYWLVRGAFEGSWRLALLLPASAALYAAGIVWNDVHDIETDRIERPGRPLPSGRVSMRTARRLGLGLLFVGIAAAACGGIGLGADDPVGYRPWLPGAIAAGLAASILCYDLLAKETRIGPLLMAACRALNLALGMTAAGWAAFDLYAWAPISMFVYISSVTFFGRKEAEVSGRPRLILGGAGIGLSTMGLAIIIAALRPEEWFPLLLWFSLAIHFGRVTIRAVRYPCPAVVQYAMKTFIFAIVAMDAVLAAAGAGWTAGVTVLGLLIPTVWLGRRLYST